MLRLMPFPPVLGKEASAVLCFDPLAPYGRANGDELFVKFGNRVQSSSIGSVRMEQDAGVVPRGM